MAYVIELQDGGILYVHVKTVWNAQDVDDFFAELRPIDAQARRRYGRVLALTRVSAVQSPIIAMQIRNRGREMKRPGDRTAMVTATMLSKLKLGRLGSNEGFGLFTSEDAARTWLLAP